MLGLEQAGCQGSGRHTTCFNQGSEMSERSQEAGLRTTSSSRFGGRGTSAGVLTVLSTVFVFGCPAAETPLSATAPFASGTRLRAIYAQVDGLRHHWGAFYDTKLGLECTFSTGGTPDGVHYCLPLVDRQSSWYADAGCSERLWEGSAADIACGSAPIHTIEPPVDSCAAHPRIFSRGAPVDFNAAHARSSDGASCSLAVGVARPLFSRGVEISISSFVLAREVVVETGGRLAVLELRAEDGARLRWGGWDTRRNEPVVSLGTEAAPRAWQPRRVAYLEENLFDDPDCTQELATKFSETAACPLTATIDGYSSTNSVHEIGPEVRGPLYTRDATGRCLPKTSDDPRTAASYKEAVYKVGPARPVAALEPAHTVEIGTGRLHAVDVAGVDGIPIQQIGYRDTALDQECKFFGERPFSLLSSGPLPDGTLRCLPVTEVGATLAIPHGEVPPRYGTHRSWDPNNCTMIVAVYQVGRYLRTESSTDHYAVGASIPLDRFVTSTRSIE